MNKIVINVDSDTLRYIMDNRIKGETIDKTIVRMINKYKAKIDSEFGATVVNWQENNYDNR